MIQLKNAGKLGKFKKHIKNKPGFDNPFIKICGWKKKIVEISKQKTLTNLPTKVRKLTLLKIKVQNKSLVKKIKSLMQSKKGKEIIPPNNEKLANESFAKPPWPNYESDASCL